MQAGGHRFDPGPLHPKDSGPPSLGGWRASRRGFAAEPAAKFPLALLMPAAGYYRALATAAGLTILANLPPLAILARRAGGLAPFLRTHFSPGGRLHQVAIVRSQFSVFRIDAVALLKRRVGPLGRLAPVLIATVVLGLTASPSSGHCGREVARCRVTPCPRRDSTRSSPATISPVSPCSMPCRLGRRSRWCSEPKPA